MNAVRVLIRSLIVAGVGAILFAFLQFPRFVSLFRTQKSINVLAWPNIIDAEYFEQFEQETGIKVYLSYFENYEELLVKLRSGSGDYDLITASDYAQSLLIKEGVVQPIDQSKLTFFKDIYPSLLNLYSDPGNSYSIPFSWELYGLGINVDAFQQGLPEASWRLLFDPAISPDRVGMLDDAREVVSIAALYLFGPHKKTLTKDDLKKIQELLIAQKPRVVMYTDLRTDYLLISQSAPVVLGFSSDLYQAMRKHPNLKFIIPKEGSFMLVDTFMIPASSDKIELVYAFLNYIYQPHIIKKYADRYSFFPALQGVASDTTRYLITPTKSLFSHLTFFSYDIPEKALRELWIALKS